MIWITIGALAWLGCSVLNYAITLAHYQRGYKLTAYERRKSDWWFAVSFSVTGPMALFVSFCLSGGARYGLMWTTRETVRARALEELGGTKTWYSICSVHFTKDPSCHACGVGWWV